MHLVLCFKIFIIKEQFLKVFWHFKNTNVSVPAMAVTHAESTLLAPLLYTYIAAVCVHYMARTVWLNKLCLLEMLVYVALLQYEYND